MRFLPSYLFYAENKKNDKEIFSKKIRAFFVKDTESFYLIGSSVTAFAS